MNDNDRIWAGIERRLSHVEPLLPAAPGWQVRNEERTVRTMRIAAGPALDGRRRTRSWASLAVAAVAVVAVIALLVERGPGPGTGSQGPVPSSTVQTMPSASVPAPSADDRLRPAIEPRLRVPVGPDGWRLIDDLPEALHLLHLLPGVGDRGLNVLASIFEPHAVYHPVDERRRLPLPDDLIAWIAEHPDLVAETPRDVEVAGLPGTSIDVRVTYRPGPRGETAQFIDIGPGPWNLEAPSRMRIVLVTVEGRRLLIVYDARPELFEDGLPAFRRLLAGLEIEAPQRR